MIFVAKELKVGQDIEMHSILGKLPHKVTDIIDDKYDGLVAKVNAGKEFAARLCYRDGDQGIGWYHSGIHYNPKAVAKVKIEE